MSWMSKVVDAVRQYIENIEHGKLRNIKLYRRIQCIIPEFDWRRTGPTSIEFTHYPTCDGERVPLLTMTLYCQAIEQGFNPPFKIDTVAEQDSWVEVEKKRREKHAAEIKAGLRRLHNRKRHAPSDLFVSRPCP